MEEKPEIVLPDDPVDAFATLVSCCAFGLHKELVENGVADVQATNQIIHHLLDFAAGAACRLARNEGREPDITKWQKAVDDVFQRAVKRTASVGGADTEPALTQD